MADIHINDLNLDQIRNDVPLKNLSFRDIDQQFILIKEESTFGSYDINHCYYCFIKPGKGIVFRDIDGNTDETTGTIKIDKDYNVSKDIPYKKFEDKNVSIIKPNGDILSNQLLTNITYDYYKDKNLIETRNIIWIDSIRNKDNPDKLRFKYFDEEIEVKIIKYIKDVLIVMDDDKNLYTISRNGEVKKVKVKGL